MNYNVLGGLFDSFKPIVGFILSVINHILLLIFLFFIAFLITFLIKCRVNPLKPNVSKLTNCSFKTKIFDLMRWLWIDFLTRKDRLGVFPDFGFTFYVGRQGGGKSISIVDYLKRMKTLYPDCMVVSNFKCQYSDYIMQDWRDLLNIRNGENGVIFAIDEIHSEYSAASWKDVPETLLSEISQQRKQKVKIVASAQYFCRIAKPLREQAFTVVACNTSFFGRLTSCKHYDADVYAKCLESSSGFSKVKPFKKYSFVQSDDLRNCYDTYEKILRMQKIKFIPRNER